MYGNGFCPFFLEVKHELSGMLFLHLKEEVPGINTALSPSHSLVSLIKLVDRNAKTPEIILSSIVATI